MQGQSFKIPKHWWGKIIGAFLGMLKGGATGLILGGIAGHMVDRLLMGFRNQHRTREVFFQALFGALGQVAKADGRVTEIEIAQAETLIVRLQLSADERQQAIRCFNAGKSQEYDLRDSMQEFVHFTAMRHDLRQMFLEILIESAATDGDVAPAEEAVLFVVSRILHIPAQMLTAMLSAAKGPGYWQRQGSAGPGPGPGAGRRSSGAGNNQPSLARAYATLGVKQSSSNAEIKKAYRKLVGQYHPDRLVSQGLPEEMMEKAKRRVREINTAYDQLKQARAIK